MVDTEELYKKIKELENDYAELERERDEAESEKDLFLNIYEGKMYETKEMMQEFMARILCLNNRIDNMETLEDVRKEAEYLSRYVIPKIDAW